MICLSCGSRNTEYQGTDPPVEYWSCLECKMTSRYPVDKSTDHIIIDIKED